MSGRIFWTKCCSFPFYSHFSKMLVLLIKKSSKIELGKYNFAAVQYVYYYEIKKLI